MENMEIENVVEEVIENVQEIMPVQDANSAVMTGAKVAGIAALVYGAFESCKWVIGKIRNWSRKCKANREAKDEDDMNADLVIDEEEK